MLRWKILIWTLFLWYKHQLGLWLLNFALLTAVSRVEQLRFVQRFCAEE